MADDRSIRSPQDAARVNLHEPHEVRYWTDKFGVSADELRQAVADVGPMAKDVAAKLGKG